MGIQDTTRLLQQMGRSYPDRVLRDEISGHLGFESVRAACAVRGLLEGGLITAQGSPCLEGVQGSKLMLTEPGMAIAFGLVCIEADPRDALMALEAQTLRQLDRHRERRRAALELPEGAPVEIRSSRDGRSLR